MKLYDYLISGLRLSSNLTIIVLEETLFKVPWLGLYDIKSKSYLIQQMCVSFVPTLSSIVKGRKIRYEMYKTYGSPATTKSLLLDALCNSYSVKECENIKKFLSTSRLGINVNHKTQFNIEEFLTYWRENTYIHIVGHGRDISPSSNSIQFPFNENVNQRNSRPLGRHIHNVRTQLLVLSACFGSHGWLDKDGTSGIVASFFASGVPNIVGFINLIDNGFCEEFFTIFYEQLLANAGKRHWVASTIRETCKLLIKDLPFMSSAERDKLTVWPRCILYYSP